MVSAPNAREMHVRSIQTWDCKPEFPLSSLVACTAIRRRARRVEVCSPQQTVERGGPTWSDATSSLAGVDPEAGRVRRRPGDLRITPRSVSGPARDPLTARQVTVAIATARGLTTREIALFLQHRRDPAQGDRQAADQPGPRRLGPGRRAQPSPKTTGAPVRAATSDTSTPPTRPRATNRSARTRRAQVGVHPPDSRPAGQREGARRRPAWASRLSWCAWHQAQTCWAPAPGPWRRPRRGGPGPVVQLARSPRLDTSKAPRRPCRCGRPDAAERIGVADVAAARHQGDGVLAGVDQVPVLGPRLGFGPEAEARRSRCERRPLGRRGEPGHLGGRPMPRLTTAPRAGPGPPHAPSAPGEADRHRATSTTRSRRSPASLSSRDRAGPSHDLLPPPRP